MATETYITVRALCAVAIAGGEDRQPLQHIPEKACIRVCGQSSEPGMIEVEWQDARYMIFRLDLDERAVPLPENHFDLAI